MNKTSTSESSPNRKPRVAIISPAHPYKGGIAQYTDALAQELEKIAKTSIISFKRLYPKLLYPGNFDKTSDLSQTIHKNAHFLLSYLSPLSWHRSIKLVESQETDVVVIAWWTLFWQPILGYIAWRLKKGGVRVVFLCHNVVDHEDNWIKRFISGSMLRLSNNYITHSSHEAAELKSINTAANILQRPHPIYTHFPRPSVNPTLKGNLSLLYFGIIRPYKGVDVLIDAMSEVKDNKISLNIVGEVWGEKSKKELETAIRESGANISYNFSYVDDQQAANYFTKADAVVLPYRSATGSGVVTLAYNYNKPVIASKIDGLTDVVINNKTGWLFYPVSSKELADTIKKVDRETILTMRSSIKQYCRDNSWENMAASIVEKYVAHQPVEVL